jgi:hypothetical protein
MAKNFPFFKFIVSEWMTGDIVFEPFNVQGLFINICALYWQRDGSLTIEDIKKRYKNPPELTELSERFIVVTDGFISIKFLDEQLIDAGHISKVNSLNGKKGAEAKANAKRLLSERSANLSKEEQEEEQEEKKNNIDIRKLKFADTLKPFLDKYGKDMMNEFYGYWTEPNKSNSKFRQELEKVWDLKKRLNTWSNNDKGFKKPQQTYNHDNSGLI